MGQTAGKQLFRKGLAGLGGHQVDQCVFGNKGGKWPPGLYWEECWQKAEGSDTALVRPLSRGWTTFHMVRSWDLELFSLKKRTDLIICINSWWKGVNRLCLVIWSGRTSVNKCKLKHSKFHLDTRKKFFAVAVAKHWNRKAMESAWMHSKPNCTERQVTCSTKSRKVGLSNLPKSLPVSAIQWF